MSRARTVLAQKPCLKFAIECFVGDGSLEGGEVSCGLGLEDLELVDFGGE